MQADAGTPPRPLVPRLLPAGEARLAGFSRKLWLDALGLEEARELADLIWPDDISRTSARQG